MGNLYSVLGVSPDASSAAIKAAYYRLAKQYHPDTHAGEAAQQRIREINDAYQVLGDLGARAAYDLLLERQRAVTQTRFWRGVAAGAVAFAFTIGSVPLLVLWQQSRTVHQETTAPAGVAVEHRAKGSDISAAEPEEAAPVLALGSYSRDESVPSQPSVPPVLLNTGSARASMRRKPIVRLAKWKRGVARTRVDNPSGVRTAAEPSARNYHALRAYVLSK
jgi:curved DNA-binding protein CbpA